jgi:Tol biopolymer transport system component
MLIQTGYLLIILLAFNGMGCSENNPLAPGFGSRNTIAFSAYRLHSGEFPGLYLMDSNGHRRMRLTPDTLIAYGPDWSPDGTKIAFASQSLEFHPEPYPYVDIYVTQPSESRFTRLTHDPWINSPPLWSPDGSRLVFTSSGKTADSGLWVMQGDGTQRVRIVAGAVSSPRWSPDGTRIVFVKPDLFNIYLINADGSQLTVLTDSDSQDFNPVWSPDGIRIAFYSYRNGNADIYAMNTDGSGLTRLTTHPAQDRSPVWSPDGMKLAFESDRDGHEEIYVMDIEGVNQRRLTVTPQTALGTDRAQTPSWSVDGKKLVFEILHGNPPDKAIGIVDSDGGNQKRLTSADMNASDPVWFPN